jgi:hypothetical protein
MGRRIVTTEFQSTRLEAAGGATVDTYFDRVIKYIPADVVSAWVFVTSVISGAPGGVPKPLVLWIAFGCGLVVTALWTWKQTSQPGLPPAVTQILISTGAFAVWVFALVGGPFANLTFYEPVYGSLALVLYTLLVALIIPKDNEPPTGTTAAAKKGAGKGKKDAH